MTYRNRKVVLQNDNASSRYLASRLMERGHDVFLRYPDSEETIPFPTSVTQKE